MLSKRVLGDEHPNTIHEVKIDGIAVSKDTIEYVCFKNVLLS